MPFLSRYIQELGVTDTGEVVLWTGVTLGVTPALSALCAPLWGRVGDRFGNKVLVQRALFSCVVVMALMSRATEPWHLFALRAVLGLLAGYGSLTLTMAALSAPPRKDGQRHRIGADGAARRSGNRPAHRRPSRLGARPADDLSRFVVRVCRGVRDGLGDVHRAGEGSRSRSERRARELQQRARVRELRAPDAGDLFAAGRGPELRSGAASACDTARVHRGPRRRCSLAGSSRRWHSPGSPVSNSRRSC